MAKGSGMIEPRMATMLGYLTTDAAVAADRLHRVLTEACRYTFNAITVDGEPSTNDCVFALASGASGVTIDDATEPALFEGFRAVAKELALGIVRGGEGATKLVAITASDAATDADAWMAARAIANSLLVKTAIHGGDPNWGRLVAAAGRSGAHSCSIARGCASARWCSSPTAGRSTSWRRRPPAISRAPTSTSRSASAPAAADSATVWTCDLSKMYVQINAEYRT